MHPGAALLTQGERQGGCGPQGHHDPCIPAAMGAAAATDASLVSVWRPPQQLRAAPLALLRPPERPAADILPHNDQAPQHKVPEPEKVRCEAAGVVPAVSGGWQGRALREGSRHSGPCHKLAYLAPWVCTRHAGNAPGPWGGHPPMVEELPADAASTGVPRPAHQ